MGVSSLPTMLLPTSPSMGSQNVLFTVMVFHMALLLTRELISQLMKCINGLRLREVASLTMFPIIWKHQPTRGTAIWSQITLGMNSASDTYSCVHWVS